MQLSCGRLLSPCKIPPIAGLVAGLSSQPLELLDRRIDKAYLGRSGMMDRASDRNRARRTRALIWPDKESDLVVYPEIADKDRQNFLRGVYCDL